VLKPDASPPSKWEDYGGLNPCGLADNRKKTLSAFTKFADFNQADNSLMRAANPLVAQNRTYTRYEVRMNREEFNSIAKPEHQWYIKSKLPSKTKPGRFDLDALEVKAAWRILTARDTPEVRRRYYVVEKAQVLDVAKTQAAGSVVCGEQDVALVGFHIVVKTKERPQWIWSSFEHIDNVPPVGTGPDREPDAKDAKVPYSYNDGDASRQRLIPAEAPPGITPEQRASEDPEPMQVIRQVPIRSETMKINRDYWGLPEIKDTVWANYMLVMTQWPTKISPEAPANSGIPFPAGGSNLANTTMETYNQDQTCMGCHHGTSNKNGLDFVAFVGVDAKDPPPMAILTTARRTDAARRSEFAKSTKRDAVIDSLVEILKSRGKK
jgi:hypothetical protein